MPPAAPVAGILSKIDELVAYLSSNVKIVEKALVGLEGGYVELLTIVALGLLAIIPVLAPSEHRQKIRLLNQLLGIAVFVFVVFTCLGVFGMVRNFLRGLSEIGRENIVALYYCSVPATILVTSLLFGPTFCGWMCPTGALQEFIGKITAKRRLADKTDGYPFSRFRLCVALFTAAAFLAWMLHLSLTRLFFIDDASIYWSEILILILFVLAWKMKDWDGKLRRLRYLSFAVVVAAAFLGLRVTSPVHFGFSKVDDPASFLATVIVVLAALGVSRVWCRYLCPWRCVISWASRYSARKLVFSQDVCIKCGKCTAQCDVDAVTNGVIDPAECHMCMKCVDVCPVKAIQIRDEWKAAP